MAKRIGPALARRPLHFFWLLDVSGSMSVDDKIGSLNNAIRSAIPHLREALADNPGIELFMRAVTFAHDAEWHLEEATPIGDIEWTDVDVVEKGTTEVGRAIALVTEKIAELQEIGRGLPPVLILVSDGKPTDFKQPSFGAALRGLEELVWGQKASRIAIGIGEDADDESLRRFIGHDEIDPIRADNPEDLLNYVRWASTVVVGDAARGAPMQPVPAEPQPLEVPLPEDLEAYNERKAQESAAFADAPAVDTPPAGVPEVDIPPVDVSPDSATSNDDSGVTEPPVSVAPVSAAPIVPPGLAEESAPGDEGEPDAARVDDEAASALLSRRIGRPRPTAATPDSSSPRSEPAIEPRGADSDVAAEPDIAPTLLPPPTGEPASIPSMPPPAADSDSVPLLPPPTAEPDVVASMPPPAEGSYSVPSMAPPPTNKPSVGSPQTLSDSLPKAEPEPESVDEPPADTPAESFRSVLDVPLEAGVLPAAQRKPTMDLPDPAPSFVRPGGMPPPSFDIRPQAPTPGDDPERTDADSGESNDNDKESDDDNDDDASWS